MDDTETIPAPISREDLTSLTQAMAVQAALRAERSTATGAAADALEADEERAEEEVWSLIRAMNARERDAGFHARRAALEALRDFAVAVLAGIDEGDGSP